MFWWYPIIIYNLLPYYILRESLILWLSLYFSFKSYADQYVRPTDPFPPSRPRVEPGLQRNVKTRDDCLQFTSSLHMFQQILAVELVQTCNFTNNYTKEDSGNMIWPHCCRILYIHCTALLYNNCWVAHPGTLLECPIFSLPMDLGKSLHVQEHVQTDWFFYENSNYKTKNTGDKRRICVALQWFWSQC